LEEEKTTFDKLLERLGDIEQVAGFIGDVKTHIDSVKQFQDIGALYQNASNLGKLYYYGEQLILVSSNCALDEVCDTIRLPPSALDKTLGGFKAAIGACEIINAFTKETVDGWKVATGTLDMLSGLANFVKFAPGVGNIVKGSLDAASAFIKMGLAIADGEDGTVIASYALDGAAGLLTLGAGIAALIPGGQIVAAALLLVAGLCKLASLIVKHWDAIVQALEVIAYVVAEVLLVVTVVVAMAIGIAVAVTAAIVIGVLSMVTLGAIAAAIVVWRLMLTAAAAALITLLVAGLMILAVGVVLLVGIVAIGLLIFSGAVAIAKAVIGWLSGLFSRQKDIATEAKKWWKAIAKKLKKAVENAAKEAARDYENGVVRIINGQIRVVERYAQGGFPSTGQTFLAREAGPELVGTIGNRNAVVNNDQIVESVSRGVYGAFMSALSSQNSGASAHATLYLDGKKISSAVC